MLIEKVSLINLLVQKGINNGFFKSFTDKLSVWLLRAL